MTNSIWDDPDIKEAVGGVYATFTAPGDSVAGTIVGTDIKRWQDGSVSPQLHIEQTNGQVITLTASHADLRRKLAAKRPEVGDDIYVEFTHDEQLPTGNRSKRFDVSSAAATKKAEAPAAAPDPVTAAPAATQQSEVDAALAALKAAGVTTTQ